MIAANLDAFGNTDIDRRRLRLLPPFFLVDVIDDADMWEWLASYWAKDLSILDMLLAWNARPSSSCSRW